MELFALLLCLLVPIYVSGDCISYNLRLTQSISNLTNCISENSHPQSFCGQCYGSNSRLQTLLKNKNETAPNGKSCIDLILDASEREPLKPIINSLIQTWNMSNCDSCIMNQAALGATVTPSNEPFYNISAYKKSVQTFFNKLDKFLTCFNIYVPLMNVSILDDLNFPDNISLVPNLDGCSNCSNAYNDIRHSYEIIVKELTEDRSETPKWGYQTCSDVDFALNRTQWAWSKIMRCHNYTGYRHKLYAVLPTGIFTLILLLFYLCNPCVNKRKDMVIYRPSRVEPASTNNLIDANNSFESSLSAKFRNLTSLPPRIRNALKFQNRGFFKSVRNYGTSDTSGLMERNQVTL